MRGRPGFLVSDHRSLVGLCVQGYKSLCAVVANCSTLVNTQTDTHSFTHTDIT